MNTEATPALVSALLVGTGGAVGALARWGTANAALRLFALGAPWGTLAANLLGCFAFGALKALLDRHTATPPAVSLALATGFLGAYTTFSTFSFETVELARAGNGRAAVAYVAVSVVLGIGLCLLGIRMFGGAR